MLKVGLTGGIGSGKTTVCDLFAGYGVPIIDADRIAHNITQRDQPGYLAITGKYGNRFLLENGEINRPLLRKQVFTSDKLKNELENLLHPLIFDEIRHEAGKLVSKYCIISIPLLAESGRHEMLDRILVIDAPDELRLQRTVKRDNLPGEQIRNIMSAQATRAQRLAIADDLIVNDGDIGLLGKQVEKLHNLYMNKASGLRYQPSGTI